MKAFILYQIITASITTGLGTDTHTLNSRLPGWTSLEACTAHIEESKAGGFQQQKSYMAEVLGATPENITVSMECRPE